MAFVIFATPFFTENAVRCIEATASLPDVRLGVISQEAQERLPAATRALLAAHWRVEDILNSQQIVQAAQGLAGREGPIHRLLSVNEHIQIPVAQAREQLEIPGMRVEVALNFRDKARMKALLRSAGLPCARYRLVVSDAEAWQFAEEAGYPLVIKPPQGAGAQSTFRVDTPAALRQALRTAPPTPTHALLIEEFLNGDEHSCDTISVDGQPVWHSITRYLPSPLEVLRNPWIQWRVMLPREEDDPAYEEIRQFAARALATLGMQTGMSHLEWFRRRDGSLAISEVAARPPGAQFTTLISRACDVDFLQAWARLMIEGHFDPPTRRYAAGAAYLRGLGHGHVRAVHGLEQAQREVGAHVTDARIPQVGQAASGTYEGEGYVIVRHPETAAVEQALLRLVSLVRIELG